MASLLLNYITSIKIIQTFVLYLLKTIDTERMFVYYINEEQMFRTYVRGDCVNKPKYRIVNRKRFNIFIISIVSIIIAIVSLFINNDDAHSSIHKYMYKEVIVNKGDTLWNIALKNMPKGYDVRKMVYEIRKFNNMDSADIYPGEIIKIPIR